MAFAQRLEAMINLLPLQAHPDPGSVKPAVGANFHIVVIGGGIAGAAFARIVLWMAHEMRLPIRLTLIDNYTCNFCAGLMTNLSLLTLRNLCRLELDPGIPLTRLKEFVFLNSSGSLVYPLAPPLVSMLRTDRFGKPGFDDSLKRRTLEGLENSASTFTLVEPAVVTAFQAPDPARGTVGQVTYRHRGARAIMQADAIILGTGLQSLNKPLLNQVGHDYGYVPPKVIPACVTEMDLDRASFNQMQDRMFIIDDIIPDAVLGLISKGGDWLTVSALNRVLNEDDLERMFSHPEVRRYIRLPDVRGALRCHRICRANIFISPARNYYGNGWLAIGDLTGHGRVFKDGYFAALGQAYLAAETILFHGPSRVAFEQHFDHVIRKRALDNQVGIGLFYANELLKKHWKGFSQTLIRAGKRELTHNPRGKWLSAALYALATGELPYQAITALLGGGLLGYAVGLPFYRHNRREQ